MKELRFLTLAACAAASVTLSGARADAQERLFQSHMETRHFAIRRHNDMPGVEAVFDDYRRNWFRRRNSDVQIGRRRGDHHDDLPLCEAVDAAANAGSSKKIACGSGHILRGSVTAFAASDTHETETREIGAITYLGYENLVTDNFFLGFGVTPGAVKTTHKLDGDKLEVNASEVGFHFIGGYKFTDNLMAAWNISYVSASEDTKRTGGVTGSFDSQGLLLTGVVYYGFDLDEHYFLSLGFDYTFVGYYPDNKLFESNGDVQDLGVEWYGDWTLSALLVQEESDTAENFIRVGVNWMAISPDGRPLDVTLDIGRSMSFGDGLAVSGALGGGLRSGGGAEGRATLRAVLKF